MVTHYPTNKWFTDLMYLAKKRGDKGNNDDYRVALSPFNVRIVDDILKNPGGTTINLPGIGFALAKPYITVIAAPTKYNLYADIYPFSLQATAQLDLGLVIPENLVSQYGVSRTIEDYDQLSFTTKWTLTGTDQSMTAPLVRGSPFITMQYNNMPVDIFEAENSGYLALASDQFEPTLLQPDKEYSGKVFRLVVATLDSAAANKKNYPGGRFPAFYNEYLIYAEKPITLKYYPNMLREALKTILLLTRR